MRRFCSEGFKRFFVSFRPYREKVVSDSENHVRLFYLKHNLFQCQGEPISFLFSGLFLNTGDLPGAVSENER